jgi:amino-acid N-acetyltransferase
MADVNSILDLVNALARDQVMLPRSPASVVEAIQSFVVADVDGAFAGCGALSIVWTDIAEIRSIAIDPAFQKLGIGKKLADNLIEHAQELGIARVMAFTYVPGFFEKLDFQIVEHSSLPHKVFNDCLNCPKFQSCDEVAVIRVLSEAGQTPDFGPLSLPRPGSPLPRLT